MKKIIAMAVAAVTLASATFALDFEIGGRFFMGKNLGGYDTAEDSAQAQLSTVDANTKLDYGFGAYANAALLAGLGLQAEANLTKGSASITDVKTGASVPYQVWTLDLPVMIWDNIKIWKVSVGAGAGVNFSYDLQPGNLKSLYEQTSANAKENAFRVGLVYGADAKLYLSRYIGIVASGRYVMDFKKKEVPLVIDGYETGVNYPTINFSRRSIYGGLGLEWKFF